MRRVVFLLFAAGLLSGCAAISPVTRLSGPAVRSALDARLGIDLQQAPQVLTSSGAANIDDVYRGAGRGGRVLVVVFDSSRAVGQILGGARGLDQTKVVRVRNVVVLYTPSARVDRTSAIRSALVSAG